MKNKLKRTIALIGMFVTVFMLGFTARQFYPNLTGNVILGAKEEIEEIIPIEEKVVILNHSMKVNSYGNLAVSGLIENIGNEKLNYVEVKVKFYDFERNILETTSKSISELEIKEKWRFEIPYPNTDLWRVVGYDIKLGEVV